LRQGISPSDGQADPRKDGGCDFTFPGTYADSLAEFKKVDVSDGTLMIPSSTMIRTRGPTLSGSRYSTSSTCIPGGQPSRFPSWNSQNRRVFKIHYPDLEETVREMRGIPE
jgi:hypothetical protein